LAGSMVGFAINETLDGITSKLMDQSIH